MTGGDLVGRESSGLMKWNTMDAAPSDSAQYEDVQQMVSNFIGGGPQGKDGLRLISGRLREETCRGRLYLVTLS